MPLTDCDSMCSMLLTVTVVMPRSELVTMRSAMSCGAKPVKFHTTLTTGILMSGKISTGVRNDDQRHQQDDDQRHDHEGIRTPKR